MLRNTHFLTGDFIWHSEFQDLTWLRPDVWVKGGDYADGGPDLPEAELMHRWGGQTVIVPYLDGRSTTRTIAAVRGHSEGKS